MILSTRLNRLSVVVDKSVKVNCIACCVLQTPKIDVNNSNSCYISHTQRWIYSTAMSCHATGSKPVIKVPKGLSEQLESLRSHDKSDGPIKFKGRIFTARPGKLLISAKRKAFNFYQNQKYDKFKPPSLASGGWTHKKSVGDYFTILAYKGNPSFSDVSEDHPSFDHYGLDQHLKDALKTMDVNRPTIIQNLAIPAISKGHNTLCAAETGSGKTLAYLLPIIQSLITESLNRTETKPGFPRVLLIVPARELAEQVSQVVKILLGNTDLNARYIHGKYDKLRTLRKIFEVPVDILISTPGILLRCLREGVICMESLSHVVIDEVDTMLDDSFSKDVINVLRNIKISEAKSDVNEGFAQLTLVGATLPKQASTILKDVIPEDALQVISTSQLHRIMPHVNQKFLRLKSLDKAAYIVELVKKDVQANKCVMVFCNEVPTCDWLAEILAENGVKALRLHGQQTPEQRNGIMVAFKKGVVNVLVCTDISSRGVDTIQVRHIINFDFPNHMSDYIHRVGRVGRVGSQSSGHVTSFVVHKWDANLVNKIERAVHVRQDLPRVNANIKQKLVRRLEEQDSIAMKQILSTID